MTMLLASVTGLAEAELALAHGADIIDLKNPEKGALGALEPAVVAKVVAAIGGQRPTSAVTGDLVMEPDVINAAVAAMAATGVDYIKVGLFPGSRQKACIQALTPFTRGNKIVGVMFADRAPDVALVPLMADAGFAGVMLDTADKSAGRLFDHAGPAYLGEFVRACRDCGLLTGLAGSLEAPDIPRLLLLAPDYLGFRGALCAAHDRRAGLDQKAINLVRGLIPRDSTGAGIADLSAQRTDYWSNAARGYAGDPVKDGDTSDRVLVHDFVLPIHIGVYEHERNMPQEVRFDVVAEIVRNAQPVQDMRDVVSYDIITDGIRLIAASGHIPLVETLAERIANFVLSHSRVQAVTVRVEKLQVGTGRVGVEIRRQRAAEVAKVYQLYPAAAGSNGPRSAD